MSNNRYEPAAGENRLIFGASYLYWNGTLCSGSLDHKLTAGENELPLLTVERGRNKGKTYLPDGTVGVSLSYFGADPTLTPFVNLSCRYCTGEERLPRLFYCVTDGDRKYPEEIPAVRKENGCLVADLSPALALHADTDRRICFENFFLIPFGTDEERKNGETEKFGIEYIAFFASREEAESFTASSDPAVFDYLKNYEPDTDVDFSKIPEETARSYEKLLRDRIAEIKNSPSALLPEQIEAAGGTCYYVSSLNGDDENDGLSPQSAWKTPRHLWIGAPMRDPDCESRAKPGDGVFFERGSEWYSGTYYNYSLGCLRGAPGVSYGAYGSGPKPLFSTALDFEGGTGHWQATEWKNVWLLDVNEYEKKEDPQWFEDKRLDIGMILFNRGEATGVRLPPLDNEHPFGEGKRSYDKGYVCTGYDYYEAGTADLTTPGTALRYDLEYILDESTRCLYLYWSKGNPGEYFDDIKVGRNGYCGLMQRDCRLDNLSFMFSSNYGVAVENKNLVVTNCEMGWVNGSLDSVESGLEGFGASDNVKYINNYVHDIGDGPLSCQNSFREDVPVHIQNVEMYGNVCICCGNTVEIFNDLGEIGADGVAGNKIRNLYIHDNIYGYCGYGITQIQDHQHNKNSDVICSSIYGEFENCRFENNLVLYGFTQLFGAYMATHLQKRGWTAHRNTYVLGIEKNLLGHIYETVNRLDHNMCKRTRVGFPYDYPTVRWFASLGVDPEGKYYYTEGLDEHEEKDCFYTNGYYVEHGGFDPKKAGRPDLG